MKELTRINEQIVACRLCPRLVAHRENIAVVKRRAFREETYWGKPIPSFGDPKALLWIIGLAPAAHGANRTGRMFTGDRSGEWLYRALYETGFASAEKSISRNDGLALKEAYISATAHCAPPDNKPTPAEIAACAPYLVEEARALKNVRVYLALGAIAFQAIVRLEQTRGTRLHPRPAFGHLKTYTFGDRVLLGSYHPSQQNTQTGRLTWEMWIKVFRTARALLNSQAR